LKREIILLTNKRMLEYVGTRLLLDQREQWPQYPLPLRYTDEYIDFAYEESKEDGIKDWHQVTILRILKGPVIMSLDSDGFPEVAHMLVGRDWLPVTIPLGTTFRRCYRLAYDEGYREVWYFNPYGDQSLALSLSFREE